MKKLSRKKTCLGIAAAGSFIGFIGVTIAVILAIFVFVFFILLLDDVTSSVDAQPTGVAFYESTGGWDYRRIALIEPYHSTFVHFFRQKPD